MNQHSAPKLLLTTSPFLKQQEDTPFIMRRVIYSLVPVSAAAVYYFGASALLIIIATTGGAVLTEWLAAARSQRPAVQLSDGSAVITGLLLALTLPPGLPLWMAFLGGVIAIAGGKLIFGGMGTNIFNPSLVGRAFLQAAFPVALTTWSPQSDWSAFLTFRGQNFSLPFTKPGVGAVTSATPLAEMKFEGKLAETGNLLLGNTAGSLGETCTLIILLCGIYLAYRQIINWRIPLGILGSVFLLAGILSWYNPSVCAPPSFHLFSGGLMLGAVFMATDPVTSPITQRGCWIFGAGIGGLVMFIRLLGGLPEGVMYAILFMNALTPLLNRVTHPRVYGTGKQRS